MKKKLFCLAMLFLILLSYFVLGACSAKKEETRITAPGTDTDYLYTEPDTTPTSALQDTACPEPETTAPVRGVWEGEDKTISFLACGDNIIYYGNVRDATAKSADGTLDFAYSYEPIAEMIANADIAFINQETLMAGDGYAYSYYPCFNSPQEVGLTLVNLGFDIVNIANNHMLDKGGDGLHATIEFWRSQPVLLLGDYLSEEETSQIDIYEYEGLKIAFVSYTYGTNGITLPAGRSEVIPYHSKELITRQMALARSQADLIIASCHWGDENTFYPNAMQKEYAQLLCDEGADVIIGHHPHVIQPITWLENADGHRTLCVYSLGNLMAEMAGQYNMLGGILQFEIDLQHGKTPQIISPVFVPSVFYFNTSFYNNTIYLLQDFTDDLASSHGIRYYGNSLSLPSIYAKLRELISEEYLPFGFDANRY